ncbi:MAG: hypothetical protein AB7X49_20915 [Geminicoccaceae bacterium]
MGRNALLVLLAAFVVLGGAVLLAQSDRGGPWSVSTETGSRIEAPGTTVQTDRDKTRVQAPGVDISIPRDKDGD